MYACMYVSVSRGMTTYDFIVSEQKKARDRDEERKKKKAEKAKAAAEGMIAWLILLLHAFSTIIINIIIYF